MVIIPLYNNKVIINQGKIGGSNNCCCDSGACDFAGTWDCTLTQESRNLISQTLSNLGYINIIVGDADIPDVTKWTAKCCSFDQNDCQIITVFCNNGFDQANLTFCRCLSTN